MNSYVHKRQTRSEQPRFRISFLENWSKFGVQGISGHFSKNRISIGASPIDHGVCELWTPIYDPDLC